MITLLGNKSRGEFVASWTNIDRLAQLHTWIGMGYRETLTTMHRAPVSVCTSLSPTDAAALAEILENLPGYVLTRFTPVKVGGAVDAGEPDIRELIADWAQFLRVQEGYSGIEQEGTRLAVERRLRRLWPDCSFGKEMIDATCDAWSVRPQKVT